MKYLTHFLPGLAILAALFAGNTQAMEITVTGEGVPPTPKEDIIVPYPYLARNLVYGYAEVLFVVDEEGTPGEFVILRDTNPAFSRAIVESVKNARYTPARLNGEKVAARVIYRNHFHYQGQAALLGAEETLPDREELVASATSRVRSIDELDAKLKPVAAPAPVYPESLASEPVKGGVMVEFYVARDGSVKAPIVVSSSHDAFSAAAIEAVRQWRFEPPTVKGKPVTVVARQPFSFGEIIEQ